MNTEQLIEYIKRNLEEKKESLPINVKAMVLFGSWAKGTATADSDVDLLIVADGINPKRHRRGTEIARIKRSLPGLTLDVLLHTMEEVISNFVNHNPLFLDVAEDGRIILDNTEFLQNLISQTRDYIRQKEIKRFGDGWLFPVEKGRPAFLSRVSNKDFAQAMLKDGERDLQIGKRLAGDGYYDKAVYHFQQSIEKSIKSVLIAMGIFQKTHLIGAILHKVVSERADITKWKEELNEIAEISESVEPEMSLSRYPGIIKDSLWLPFDEYDKEDAYGAMIKADRALSVAARFVEDWFSTSC
jgi:HEPN domain-containing protein/predicted nucleotidyltransferase